jgi:hypothetical protein
VGSSPTRPTISHLLKRSKSRRWQALAGRVLAYEGLAESYNIAEFLRKTEGSGELRRPVPLHRTTCSSWTRPASSAPPTWP